MSMFLPEEAQQPQSGIAAVTPASPETTQEDIALMQRVLAAAARNPNLMPTDFMAYMADFLQTQRLQVPIGLVSGFTPYANDIQSALDASTAALAAANAAAVKAFLNTSGSLLLPAHTAETGSGPALSGLTAGNYIVMAGYDNTNADAHSLTVDQSGMVVGQGPQAGLWTLAGTSFTTTLAGTGAGAAGSISNCWLLAIKYS